MNLVSYVLGWAGDPLVRLKKIVGSGFGDGLGAKGGFFVWKACCPIIIKRVAGEILSERA